MKIYITPTGIVKGENPEYPFLKKPDWSPITENEYNIYQRNLKLAQDNAIPFEEAWRILQPEYLDGDKIIDDKGNLIPGLYSADVEAEVIYQLKTISGQWVETYGGKIPECELENPSCEYRTVLRIVEKPKTENV